MRNARTALDDAARLFRDGLHDEARRGLVAALADPSGLDDEALDRLLLLNLNLRGQRHFAAPPDESREWTGAWSDDGRFFFRHPAGEDCPVMQVCGAGVAGVLHEAAVPGRPLTHRFRPPREGLEARLFAAWTGARGWLHLARWDESAGFTLVEVARPAGLGLLQPIAPLCFGPDARHLFVSLSPPGDTRPTAFAFLDLGPADLWAGLVKPPAHKIAFTTGETLRCGVSPDGGLLALVPVNGFTGPGNEAIVVVDVATLAERRWPVEDVPRGIQWSPCGRWLAVYTEPALYRGNIRVYDVASGKVVARHDDLRDPDEDSSMADSVYYAAADHDRSGTLRWAQDEPLLHVLDRASGTWLDLSVPGGPAAPSSWSPPRPGPGPTAGLPAWLAGPPCATVTVPPGTVELLSWPDGTVLGWDLAKRALLFRRTLPAPLDPAATDVAASGSFLLIRTTPPSVLELPSGRLRSLDELTGGTAVTQAVLRPGSDGIIMVLPDEVLLYDPVTAKPRWRVPSRLAPTDAVHVSPDGRFILLFDLRKGRVRALDGADGSEAASWPWWHDRPHRIEAGAGRRQPSLVVVTKLGSVVLQKGTAKPRLLDEHVLRAGGDAGAPAAGLWQRLKDRLGW